MVEIGGWKAFDIESMIRKMDIFWDSFLIRAQHRELELKIGRLSSIDFAEVEKEIAVRVRIPRREKRKISIG